MGWLQTHLDSFVVPVLGHQPAPVQPFTQIELAIMKNMWRSVKREAQLCGRPLLLAGRDVWVFEVLARRENFPTVFRPDISRMAVPAVEEDYSGYFLFDTGFVGSIPRGLGIQQFLLASGRNQVFPKLTGARSLVLKIEKLPKYWKAGTIRDGKIVQFPAEPHDFEQAAGVTIAIYTNSAPRFVDLRQALRTGAASLEG